MIAIGSLIPRECVLINPQVEDRESLLQLMVDRLNKAGKVQDSQRLFQDVMEREALSSTALGFGCAVPHAHSPGVAKTVIAAAVISQGIDYDAPDGEPVELVFLMAGSAAGARLHLKVLSKLARFLHDEEFREQLKKVADPEEFLALVQKKDG